MLSNPQNPNRIETKAFSFTVVIVAVTIVYICICTSPNRATKVPAVRIGILAQKLGGGAVVPKILCRLLPPEPTVWPHLGNQKRLPPNREIPAPKHMPEA